MNYKMIISDMDGTLLADANTLSPENKSAILKACEKGVVFVIATGRSVKGVIPYLKTLNLYGNDGYVVCQNGGVIYNLKDITVCKQYNFTTTEFESVFKFAKTFDDTELFYYDNMELIVETVTKEVEGYCDIMGIKPIVTEKPMNYENGFTKVVIHGTHETLLKIQADLRKDESSSLDCFFSHETYLEFVKKGVNKGVALDFVANELGFKHEEIVAIGDSENDISMITKAGLGVAMGNSMDIVKDVADVVLDKDNAQHGVADMIERYILV